MELYNLLKCGNLFYSRPLEELFKEEVDVIACQPYSNALIPYRVTPLRLFSIMQVITELLDLVAERILHKDQPVYLSMQGIASEYGSILCDRETLMRRIMASTMAKEPTAQAMLEWMLETARVKPDLFQNPMCPSYITERYITEPKEENTLLLKKVTREEA